MRFLIVFSSILVCLILISCIRLRLFLILDNTKFSCFLKVFFLRFNIAPSQKKIKFKNFTRKTHKKFLLKKKKKLEGKKKKILERKKEHQTDTTVNPSEKTNNVRTIFRSVKKAVGVFGKHLLISIRDFYISVGSDDAAQTAVMYGLVYQFYYYLFEFLSIKTNVDTRKCKRSIVTSDFLSEKYDISLDIILSIRIWQVLHVAFSAGFIFLNNYLKDKRKRKESKKWNKASLTE